jgi:hypothetical protein
MPVTAGIDLMRGRPTPAIGTTEAKLQQRKLDALRRGVHRVTHPESLPYGVHVIGIGGAGTGVVERMLRDAPANLLATDGSRLSALAIDIGTGSLAGVEALAAGFRADRAQIETLALAIPQADVLARTFESYRGFLELEYPLLQGSTAFEPWLDATQPLPAAGEPVPRALAKAVYGQAYYDGERPMAAALKRFAASTNATQGDAVVCIVFGLGGGTGSGMALDLARHLSTGLFGRRVLVLGIGIAPCEGDLPVHRGGAVFSVLNELDSLCDEAQNRGVVQACGELYKNPFTAGFLLVPQQAAFAQAHDGTNLVVTHTRVDGELAALLTQRHGANLWEVLRLLNWVAAPSTQHSAARTPWGAKWMHVLGFDDATRAPAMAVPAIAAGLGLLPGYAPEFIELRVAEADAGAQAWAAALDATFAPDAAATVAAGGAVGSVQFVLPRAAKTDLELFFAAREAYDRLTPAARVASHALLLERGVVLCEPSTRIEGMAGAGLNGSDAWVGVPLEAMRGPAVNQAAEVRHAA